MAAFKLAGLALTKTTADRKLKIIKNEGIARNKVKVRKDPNGYYEIWVKGLTTTQWRALGF